MQAFLDRIEAETGYGFVASYMDDNGLNFGIAAGERSNKFMNITVPGNITEDDTMILGSGTKPMTATAVLRLIDQGKIQLEDKAYMHIDEPMKKFFNRTMASLFGEKANNITVKDLLWMRSGLQDYEIP